MFRDPLSSSTTSPAKLMAAPDFTIKHTNQQLLAIMRAAAALRS